MPYGPSDEEWAMVGRVVILTILVALVGAFLLGAWLL